MNESTYSWLCRGYARLGDFERLRETLASLFQAGVEIEIPARFNFFCSEV